MKDKLLKDIKKKAIVNECIEILQEKGWTLKDIAFEFDVTECTISLWRKGNRNPSKATIEKFQRLQKGD